MSAPVGEDEKTWTAASTAAATQNEPIATEPLERVGTEKELNQEKLLDKDYVQQKEANQHAQNHPRTPLGRLNSDWTSSSNDTPDDKSEKSVVVAEKQTWAERINPLKSKHKPPIPAERGESREYKASFLSHLTFQWMAPLMEVSFALTF
jgi:ATP-binding cassette subfamily C (CFTR/MRP) protein 1